jgi:hypothetical protein
MKYVAMQATTASADMMIIIVIYEFHQNKNAFESQKFQAR